jgi:HEAT repeat protein
MRFSKNRVGKRAVVALAVALVLGTPVLASARLRATLLGSSAAATTQSLTNRNSDNVQLANTQSLLARMRGTNALACELAMVSVDHGNWFGRYHPMASPAMSDSAILDIPGELTAPVVLDRLWAALRDQDACVRRTAASLLGRTHAPGTSQRLIGALGESEAELRRLSAFALGLAEDSSAARTIEGLLRDSDETVRATAAWALGEMEYKPAVPALATLLGQDRSAIVRRAAARALGRISNEEH